MAKAGLALDRVLLIEVPDDLIIERGTGRRTDPVTGRIYHLKYDPPPAEIADRLVHRKDDVAEAITKRLDYYHSWTAATIAHYRDEGLLRTVDGVGTPDEVTHRITQALAK